MDNGKWALPEKVDSVFYLLFFSLSLTRNKMKSKRTVMDISDRAKGEGLQRTEQREASELAWMAESWRTKTRSNPSIQRGRIANPPERGLVCPNAVFEKLLGQKIFWKKPEKNLFVSKRNNIFTAFLVLFPLKGLVSLSWKSWFIEWYL